MNRMNLHLTEYPGQAILVLYILYVTFADGQRDVDISVHGKHVVKTDIATYTIYGSGVIEENTLTISCLSFLPVPTNISLLRDGIILNPTFADTTDTNRSAVYYFQNPQDVTQVKGNYSCLFHSSAYNGSQFYMERKIGLHINTTTEIEVCGSSVGSSGFFGEKVTLFCENPNFSRQLSLFQVQGQQLSSLHTMEVRLFEWNTTLECSAITPPGFRCKLPIKVYGSLQVKVLPKNFTLDSQLLNFSCQTTPPRMMYWEIIGDDENALDITGRLLQAGCNITIEQEAGLSWLTISSSINVKEDLGIRKVVCYAHGTRIRSVSIAIEPIPDNTQKRKCNTSLYTDPTQTSSPAYTTFEEISVMTEVSQTGNRGDDNTVNFMPASTNTGPLLLVTANGKEGIFNNWEILYTISAIAVCEALLLLLIAGIWTYRKCFRKNNSHSSKCVSTGDVVSSETELHENPVYQSYHSPEFISI